MAPKQTHLLIITRGYFDWVLGFGATQLNTQRLNFWLPHFAELSFLREADERGKVPVLLSSIRHLESKDRFLNAVQRALGVRELLTYTSLVTIQRESSVVVEEEMVYSSQFGYWGMPLPECPKCGNHGVRATARLQGTEDHGKKKNEVVFVRCHGCKSSTKGDGVSRPAGVRPVAESYHGQGNYFWKPLRLGCPWAGHRWREPPQVDPE
jgi:hypothetical protein